LVEELDQLDELAKN
jgi:hypothetical protein